MLKEYINKAYWDNNQVLDLISIYDEDYELECNTYFEQQIWLKEGKTKYIDKFLFKIQTLDACIGEDLSIHPYYLSVSDSIAPLITVPKFGQLSFCDISKAIAYYLSINDMFLLFNINYNNKQIKYINNSIYTHSREELIKTNYYKKVSRRRS